MSGPMQSLSSMELTNGLKPVTNLPIRGWRPALCCRPQPTRFDADAAAVNATLSKLVYNEMVEFWGSLFEYVTYQVKGMPVEKQGKESAILLYLRSVVLLDVNPAW